MASGEEAVVDDEDALSFRIIPNPLWRMELLKPIHANYCRHLIFGSFTQDFQEYDMSKLTFLQFALSCLDILQSIDFCLTKEEKNIIIDSIYSLFVLDDGHRAGFFATRTLMLSQSETSSQEQRQSSSHAIHVTMTFAALVSLITLEDDLSNLNSRQNILVTIASFQNKDGSFRAGPSCCESDMRFVYSAVSVCYILNNFSFIDVSSLLSYIKKSLTYEGSFGSGSCGTEGHAAYTFCAVASLVLLDKLNETLSYDEINRIRRWCLFRQINGFNGRPNKEEDTCYSFWVGGTLSMLGSTDFSDCKENIDYILHNQNPITGGIGKWDNESADPLHTLMGIAGLSLAHYENLNRINPALIMTEKAVTHMEKLHKRWASGA